MTKLKHTANELKQMQSLPLDIKIQMSCRRIREWYDHYQGDVCISFSGGKDSTVLMDLVKNRCGLKDVPVVFVDTGLEFPEIKEFARKHADVVLRPEKNFKEVLTKCGYPVISKRVARTLRYTQHYLSTLTMNQKDRALAPITDEGQLYDEVFKYKMLAYLRGIVGINNDLVMPNTPKKYKSYFNYDKYAYLLNSDFKISEKCCDIMKKAPLKKYQKEHGLHPYVGTMADESTTRKYSWFKVGCNAFDLGNNSRSAPLSFWTEQDILQYICKNNLPICSIYGDIIENNKNEYSTTKEDRTGCVYCPLGCHLEKEPNRFQRLKETHPKLYDYCINGGEYNEEGKWQPSIDGLGLGHVLDFIGVKY